MRETRQFYLTSEFWITVATIVAALAGALPIGGRTASILATVSAAAYALSRGLAKSGVPAPDPSDVRDPVNPGV